MNENVRFSAATRARRGLTVTKLTKRKLTQPAEEGVPSDIPAGTALARGDDDVPAADADDENLLIDLPWTMFGEKPGTPQKGGASGIDATPPS